MIRRLAVVVAIATLAIGLAGCDLAPTYAKQKEQVDNLLWEVNLDTFDERFHNSHYKGYFPGLNWTTDGCSGNLPDSFLGIYNFTHPCHRHDFGYRNHKLLESRWGYNTWHRDIQQRINVLLYVDMNSTCQWWNVACKEVSTSVFEALTAAGFTFDYTCYKSSC